MTAPLTLVELFAGAGGFGLGFRAREDVEVAWALENAPWAVDTYRHNFPDTPLVAAPAQQVAWDRLGDEHGEPDIVIAGPPCESYTPAKASRRADPLERLYEDPAGGLVLHTILALRALRPQAFIIENVVQLGEGPLERELRDLLRRAGYDPHFHVLRNEEHGGASRRARLFISSHRLETTRAPPRTVRDAIGDLEDLDAPVTNHHPERVPRKFLDEVEDLAAGRSLQFWKGATGKRYGTWTRLAYDEVAPTVKGSGRFIHPTLDRALTPREHARLMGFPDTHFLEGSLGKQYDQAGEAVPVPLASALADALVPQLDR